MAKLPKDARLADILGEREFMVDHSRMIGEAMGREFFRELEATFIHRVGLRSGLGWKFPAAKDGIDFVRVVAQGPVETTTSYHMLFGRQLDSNVLTVYTQCVRHDVPLHRLRQVFDEETINEV